MADFDLTMVRAPGGEGRERAPGGYGLLDLPFLRHLFHYSLGLDPVGSIHFRAPDLALAVRRDRARRGKGRGYKNRTAAWKKIFLTLF